MVQDGLCLVCAKELGIKPVDDLIDKFGITEEEMEQMEQQLSELMSGSDDQEGFTRRSRDFPFFKTC